MERSIKRRLTALEQGFEDDLEIEDLVPLYREIFGEDDPFFQRYKAMSDDGSLERAIREQIKAERKRRKW